MELHEAVHIVVALPGSDVEPNCAALKQSVVQDFVCYLLLFRASSVPFCGKLDDHADGQADGCVGGWMDGRLDGWLVGWMDG